MKNLLPTLIIGGIGYYLYKNWDSISGSLPLPLALVTAPNGSTSINPGIDLSQPTPVGDTQPALTSTPTLSVKQEMLDWVSANPSFFMHGGSNQATFDEWNWVRGKFMSAPEGVESVFPGTDRAELRTFDEYWNALIASGAHGLSGLGNLGQILDMGQFFQLGPNPYMRTGNFR